MCTICGSRADSGTVMSPCIQLRGKREAPCGARNALAPSEIANGGAANSQHCCCTRHVGGLAPGLAAAPPRSSALLSPTCGRTDRCISGAAVTWGHASPQRPRWAGRRRRQIRGERRASKSSRRHRAAHLPTRRRFARCVGRAGRWAAAGAPAWPRVAAPGASVGGEAVLQWTRDGGSGTVAVHDGAGDARFASGDRTMRMGRPRGDRNKDGPRGGLGGWPTARGPWAREELAACYEGSSRLSAAVDDILHCSA